VVKRHPLEEIKPLLLFQLLMRSEMLRIITRLIYDLYGRDQNIHYDFLKKKTIEKFGGREISSRSLRNFLKTLVTFDVLHKEDHLYVWQKPLEVREKNLCYMLRLYAEEYKKSPQILIDELETYLFIYFKLPDAGAIGRKYNNILWKYSQNLRSKQILLSNIHNAHKFVNNLEGI
jgi:hypothetical protein